MAEEFPNPSERLPKLNRRKLLATAAGIGAASFVPSVAPSEAVLVSSGKTVSKTSAPILNLGAATARRLLQIRLRNELRREAKLPLLRIVKELRQMKMADDSMQFSEAFRPFAAKHSKAVWDEVLEPRRGALGDLEWKPRCWSEGVGYQSEVYRILRQRFEGERSKLLAGRLALTPTH